MEGHDIPGPKVWLDLNRKCETKIIAFFKKNEERSSWMKPYLEECKKKLGVACPDPTFVPKTPSQPKRGGRRMKASTDGKESAKSGDVSNNSSRKTRATRGSERNATQDIDTTDSTVDATTSCTPPAMKEATSPLEESEEVFSAEPGNATYSSQDDTYSSAVTADATFEVGSTSDNLGKITTFETVALTVANNATFEKENDVPQDIFIEEHFVEADDVAKPVEEDKARPVRSTRSKPKQLTQSCSEIALTKVADSLKVREIVAPTVANNATFESENDDVLQDISTEEQFVQDEDFVKPAEEEEARPVRSTRSKLKQLAQLCSEIDITKGAELTAQVLTPTLMLSNSSSGVGYTGSPVKDGVKVIEQGMRDSAGPGAKRTDKENTPMKQAHYSKHRSSIRDSLAKASAARNLSVADILEEQEVDIVSKPAKKGSTFKKSPGLETLTCLNNSRAPAGKIVRPGRKVFASGGRGVSPGGPRSGSATGSSSKLMRSRSRLDIIKRAGRITPSKPNTPGNLAKGGMSVEKQRRDEGLKNKMDEQRLKREERIRRVQEARQKQESLREDKLKKNQEKDKADKLGMLKKREDNLKVEKQKRETEMKLKQAEERRNLEEEERLAKKDKLEIERREDERRKDDEQEGKRKKEEEERRKKLQDDEIKKRQEINRKNEEKKRAAEDQLRIQREKEEIQKIKEREAARESELNSTYNKPADSTFNKTVDMSMDQSQVVVSSYDMTPARHELPPEPSKDEDDYGLDDLKSDEDTDDEDCPRKQVPKWAEGAQLRTALLKQCYMGPDLDTIFCTVEMPDLSAMFDQQRKRFFKRTSSACWETPPESFKHSKKR